jgi:hypothetical protein
MMPCGAVTLSWPRWCWRLHVQIVKQLAFPVVPDLWAGAPDVGMGQQIEGGQVTLVANQLAECTNHVGVTQVFLLGYLRHDQVMFDQPDNQFGIFFGKCHVLHRNCGRLPCRVRNGRHPDPWRYRGIWPPHKAARGVQIRRWREQTGYSWANSLIVKRRRLRKTCRMCWSTV